MSRTVPALLVALLTIGCDIEEESEVALNPVDLDALVTSSGCSDVTLTLDSEGGDLSLVFSWYDELAEQALTTGQPQSATIDLSAAGRLVLRSGANVDELECTDYFDDTQVVDVEWEAVSGTVELLVETLQTEDDLGMPAPGSVTITDAVLSADGEDDVIIDTLTWSAGVGWIAAG